MVVNIILPELDSKPENTKDAVISLLTMEWPLTLREIFYHIRKKYGYSHSYQAVYKAVKELIEKDVLLEKDKKYSFNIDWIKKVQSFTDVVETNYYAKDKMNNLSGLNESKHNEDIMVMNFDSIFDAEKYLYYFMKYNLFKTNNDTVCYSTNSEWRPLFYLRAEYNYYSRLIKRGHKFFFLCSGKSDIESVSGKFYESVGIKFKSINQKFTSDTLIFGNFCINIFIPEDIKIKLRKLLDSQDSKTLVKSISEVLSAKSSIRVIITKDEGLANEFKKDIISKFKK
jgi:hypothetical protein